MKEKKASGKFFSWHLWANLLAMFVVVLLLIIGLKWWLQSYTHHGEGIAVPDLYGMDYRRAMELAEERGLEITATDSTYIKEMPAGCVVVQSPARGMEVKMGRTIYVTINSLTIPRVRIPDLIDNCSYREAEAKLRQLDGIVPFAGLGLGANGMDQITAVYADGIMVGKAIIIKERSSLTGQERSCQCFAEKRVLGHKSGGYT